LAQVPLTLATLFLAAAVLPEVPADRSSRFDIPGGGTLGLGALSLLLAINRGPKEGWTSALVLGGIALAMTMFATFIAIERRVSTRCFHSCTCGGATSRSRSRRQFFTNFAYMVGSS